MAAPTDSSYNVRVPSLVRVPVVERFSGLSLRERDRPTSKRNRQCRVLWSLARSVAMEDCSFMMVHHHDSLFCIAPVPRSNTLETCQDCHLERTVSDWHSYTTPCPVGISLQKRASAHPPSSCILHVLLHHVCVERPTHRWARDDGQRGRREGGVHSIDDKQRWQT